MADLTPELRKALEAVPNQWDLVICATREDRSYMGRLRDLGLVEREIRLRGDGGRHGELA